MSGYRGYRNYRGRRSGGKTVLSVILILIILASVAFMMLQKQVIYDENGTPHFALLQKQPKEAPQEDEEVKLTIRSKEETPLRLFAVEAAPLTKETWHAARLAAEEAGDFGGAVVFAKTDDGRICFDADAAADGAQAAEEETVLALEELLRGGTAADYAVAGLTCFRDPYAATHDPENAMGLRRLDGELFADGNGVQWMDPGKPAARQYLCALAGELAAMGFDEILLSEVSYPVSGALEQVDYGESVKTRNILAFLEEMRAAVERHGAVLSIRLPESVVIEGSDNVAGLVLEDILARVDRVYAHTAEETAAELAQKLAAKGVDFLPILPAGHSWEGSCLTEMPQREQRE